MDNSGNTKRIAKNTLFLYLRMMLMMAVSLYTSRLVLNTLGVTDYGIQNVVGGFVSTFSLISATMNTTISRFLTFELGKGDMKKLNVVFSTSVNIQIILSIIIILIAETVGLWFLYNKMVIPDGRMYAAFWVYQCSLISFILNLITVPYSSILISRERMGLYAYLSILEVILKLLIVYLLTISEFDKLITYTVLLMLVSGIMRIIYGTFCVRHFEESKYRFIYDHSVVKEMMMFSGYNYLGAAAYILRYQGLNVLTNLFFGVAVNAARGIVASVESSVSQFVGNFTLALNPPITKAYSRGDIQYMHTLVCQGAKYSFFMMLFLVMPIFFEAPVILKLWLKIVPEFTILFLRITMIIILIDVLSNTITTAILATGNIKFPQLVLSSLMMSVFPITYILFKIGMPAYTAYLVFAVIVILRIVVELIFLQKMVKLSGFSFFYNVIRPCFFVAIASLIPYAALLHMDSSLYRLIITIVISFTWTAICVYCLGMTSNEKSMIRSKLGVYLSQMFQKLKKNEQI